MKNNPVFKSFEARAKKITDKKRKDLARNTNVQPKNWNPLPTRLEQYYE